MKTAGTNAQKAERIARRAETLTRINELGADAERYRWLTRMQGDRHCRTPQMRVMNYLTSIRIPNKTQIDIIIDTARAMENRIDIRRECCSPHCAWTGFVKLVTDGGPRCPVCAERTMAVYP